MNEKVFYEVIDIHYIWEIFLFYENIMVSSHVTAVILRDAIWIWFSGLYDNIHRF